jgi:hypothetical protein
LQRTSARYVQGLTVASEDYQKEVQAREEVEAEVKRLRAQMYGQNARLSMIDADLKRQNTAARRSRELAQNIHGLETDISKLRAERDITIAEVEELASSSKYVSFAFVAVRFREADDAISPEPPLWQKRPLVTSLRSRARSAGGSTTSRSNTAGTSSR